MAILSALVCTCNRPRELVITVRSLLASDIAELELLIVDQSDAPISGASFDELRSDPRLRYIRSRTRGKGAALNEGLRQARGDVVICTDDDCEAAPDWLASMGSVFEEEPSAALAFCNVVAPPYDKAAGYVPTYEKPRRVLRSVSDLCAGRGIGAGMAVRRSVALEIGGFDESLGPGARFPAAEDLDFALRLLLRGWHVYDTGDRPIVHHGFRTHAQSRAHAKRDFIGLGAVCAKPLRAGYWNVSVLSAWEFSANALWPPLADLLHLKKPRGLSRIIGFLQGFIEGMQTPVAREALVYAKDG